MEYWWDMQIRGQKSAGVAAVPAKWTYAEALAEVRMAPTVQLDATETSLNTTSLTPPSVYEAQYNVLYSTQREGTVENGYRYVEHTFLNIIDRELTDKGSRCSSLASASR
jgi:hypothetical protein